MKERRGQIEDVKKESSFSPGRVAIAVVLAIVVLFSVKDTVLKGGGEGNLYVLQADAFLKGRTDIDRNALDAAVVNGRYYLPFPPAPAALLVPFVAILGTAATDPGIVALLLTVLSVFVARSILVRLEVDRGLHPWLLSAFFLGTGYWLALKWSNRLESGVGGVWYFAHVVAVTFLLLAIRESLGKRRGWLAGLFLGAAFLSRQFTLLGGLFIAAAIWEGEGERSSTRRRRIAGLAGFTAMLAVALAIYLAFNQARFGNPLDTGYGHLKLSGFLRERVDRHGLFSLAYVPFNLYYLLLNGFNIAFTSADRLRDFIPDPFGTSLVAASPFLFVAVFAGFKQPRLRACWAATALMACAHLLYYNNGWLQHNAQRFTLDFLPLLLVPLSLGLARQEGRAAARPWKWLIAYAVALNMLVLALMEPINAFLAFWADTF